MIPFARTGTVALVPALEIGGTHVTAAAVDPARWTVADSVTLDLDGRASADELLHRFAEAMALIHTDVDRWGAAVPGPFDYGRGVARYTGVGKFESLHGIDVGRALGGLATSMTFVNDADATLLGEVLSGRTAGHDRCMGITLGTGVGSAFVADGRLVRDGPGVPPDAEVHLLDLDGVPLEDVMSRRAILRDYRRRVPAAGAVDVREIAELARRGDPVAGSVLSTALLGMCRVLAPCVRDFGATALVVGGSIAQSWDLVGPALRAGLGPDLTIVRSPDSARSALFGAAHLAGTELGS